MTIDEMKQRKKEFGYSYQQISHLSGVPLSTVQKIFRGATQAPRYETLLALEKVFEDKESSPARLVRETASYEAKQQGTYTLDDYYRLPEDFRAELIDGVIYEMSAPASSHQLIAGLLHAKLFNFVASRKGDCLPVISPIDVQLDKDNKTMLQPDVAVVCDRSKIINRCIYGAPDFIIEILSPSSKKRDSVIKLNKYMNAGVQEYWLIDPDNKTVIVYDFAHDNYPAIYGFDAKVPVFIWNSECVIDFQEVFDYVRFLYE